MAYKSGALKNLTSQLRLKDGVSFRTLTGAVTCNEKTENICFWDPGGASRDVTLMAEAEANGLFMFFYNEADDAENLVIKDDAASTIVTIGRGEWAIVACDGTTWRDMPLAGLADSNAWTGTQTFQNVLFGTVSTLTIASGAVAATRTYHQLDTESAAASDDLDDITGGAEGELLFVRLVSAARNVVLKHAVGANKIANPGGLDITLDVLTDWALLMHNGSQWTTVAASTLTNGFLAATNAFTGTQTFQNMIFGSASELTIASGAIAATRSYHTVDTESDAASDDLDDITGLAAGEILFIRPDNTARSVVLRHAIGSNKIATPGARNITLAETTDWALLMGDGTQAVVIAASTLADGLLSATNAWTGAQTFQNLLLGASSELTIASGAVAATRSFHTIDTESDAASDDLDDITGGAAGELLLIRPENGSRTVVLRHAIGANKIATLGGRNISLTEATDWALLVSDGTQWAVIAFSTLTDGIFAGTNTWSGTQSFSGTVNLNDGSLLQRLGAGSSGDGDTIERIGATTSEGMELRVWTNTVSPAAIETALFTVPANSVIDSVQANVQSALTGGGTTVTFGIGITGDVDLYGTAFSGGVQADLLTQNAKINAIGTKSNAGAGIGVYNAATVALKLIGAATGGTSAGDTALTVGSVRVVVRYRVLVSLANA